MPGVASQRVLTLTIAVAIGWSIFRSVCIALLGMWLARITQSALQQGSRTLRSVLWMMLLSPFFTPSLMTGFCYRDTAMSLLHVPVLKELLYGLIICMQLVPVAVVLLVFAPEPEVSDTALRVARFSNCSNSIYRRLLLHSKLQFDIIAGCTLFLLSFQEAELASLMQAASWTEWIFTRHATGLSLAMSLKLIVVPVLVQLPCLIAIAIWLKANNDAYFASQNQSSQVNGWHAAIVFFWVLLAFIVVTLVPAWQLTLGALRGSGGILNQPSLPRELGDSLLLALTTGFLAILLGQRVVRSQRLSCGLLWLLILPGCMGNLVLGLLFAGIFQTDLLRFAYDTPAPLIFAEVLWLLPRTLILFRCLQRSRSSSADYQLELFRHSKDPLQVRQANELHWQFIGRVWLAMTCIVCFWSYLELMLPSILVFPGMAPVSLVLYNAMHYGRISVLGMKLLITLVVPVILVLILITLRKVFQKFSMKV